MTDKWSPFEDELMRGLKIEGRKWDDIAATLNRSKEACKARWALKVSAMVVSEVYWTPELNQALIDCKNRNLNVRDIATALGVSVLSVSRQ